MYAMPDVLRKLWVACRLLVNRHQPGPCNQCGFQIILKFKRIRACSLLKQLLRVNMQNVFENKRLK